MGIMTQNLLLGDIYILNNNVFVNFSAYIH